MRVGALVLVVGCGRIGFDATGVASDGAGGSDAVAEVLPPGAKIWLKMETEPLSGIVDSAGGHSCFCSATTGCPTRVDGKHGSGYRFSGHEVGVTDAANLNPSSGFTAAAWVRVDSYPVGTNGAVFAKPSATGDMFGLIVQSDGTTLFDSEDASGTTASITGDLVPLGEWHHLAFVFDGTRKLYYVDGALLGMSTNGLSTGNEPFFVGADYATVDDAISGTIDDVLYYTRALSLAEVAQLAAP